MATSPKHPVLSKRRWIKAEDIQDYLLIIFPQGAHTRNVLKEFFKRVGIAPRIVVETENVATIKPLVRINLRVSMIPFRSVAEEVRRRELYCLRIRNHKVTR